MNNWFVLSLISAFGFGIIPLFLKVVQQTVSPQIVVAIYYSIAAVVLWIFAFSSTKVTLPDSKQSMLIFAAAVLGAVSELAIFFAYKYASNAGFPRSIQAFSIVIATILSAYLFHQAPGSVAVIGTVLIFSGVVILSLVK